MAKKLFFILAILIVAFSVVPSFVHSQTVTIDIEQDGPRNLMDLVNGILTWIFNIAIPIAAVMIIYGGITMVTAGGVPAKYDKGKDILKYAIIGLVVIFIGRGFISLIQSILELGS